MKATHVALTLGSALITMLGIGASVWGTYLMTLSFHPFDSEGFLDFVVDSPRFAMALIEKRRARVAGRSAASKKALQDLETISKLAEVNPERRDISLVGVGLLFMGFVLQSVGVICSIIDIIVV